MSRSPIQVRDAEPDDAVALLLIWSESPRRTSPDKGPDREGQALADVRASLARIAAEPSQRLVVAVVDDVIIGAAMLSRVHLSPLGSEDAVQVSHLQVTESARRHGAGKALMDTAVSWAEDKGASTVLVAAPAQDRDANRYLARLGFSSVASLRSASVSALRAGPLRVEPPACARTDVRTSRTVGQILAQRRLQRRTRSDQS